MNKKININKVLTELTTEEKCSMCTGIDFWHTKNIDRLGIPSLRVSDGPHGLRKMPDQDHLWARHTVKAVCYPTASALASSWDQELIGEVGQALGREARAQEVNIILGPGMNIKRSPLCGRNFEYFSEDPHLTAQCASALVKGIQSQGAGACIKHFACNNQETERMTSNSLIDERTMHEIYLAAFEEVVKESKPWAVMCSYNKINGTWVSENRELLTRILREKWGFEGIVISDWAAVVHPVEALKAGLDLEMPGTGGVSTQRLLKALEEGKITEEDLDLAVKRILEIVNKKLEHSTPGKKIDTEAHHQLARKAAAGTMVLLKNDNGILPLDMKKFKKIAVIGEFAKHPRYQGGGSSHVDALKEENAFDHLAAGEAELSYARGYSLKDPDDSSLINEAADLAAAADCALVFAGLPDSYEVEASDRLHMNLPAVHNALIEKILEVQPRVVVVLVNGSTVILEGWLERVDAVLESWLGGQASGAAVADILLGRVNPSGKLSESFPRALEDNPTYLYFPGENREVIYGEGVYVGYRYYEKKRIPVRFPFGFGLSYTEFEYSNLKLSHKKMKENEKLSVSITVKNKGLREGQEVIQLYVRDEKASFGRPEKELKGFAKVSLKPGHEKRVEIKLDSKAFRFYHPEAHDWIVEEGEFRILVGASSADIRLEESVYVEKEKGFRHYYTIQDPMTMILDNPLGEKLLFRHLKELESKGILPPLTREQLFTGGELPIGRLMNLSGGRIKTEDFQKIIDKLNE